MFILKYRMWFWIVITTAQNEVIRIRKSKDRQHNDQKKKDKRTNNDPQYIHIKLKIEQHEPHKKPGVNSGVRI